MASSILSRGSSLQAQNVSKADVLQWLSDVLALNVTKLEQLQNGALYCQVLDAFDGRVQLQKVVVHGRSSASVPTELTHKDCFCRLTLRPSKSMNTFQTISSYKLLSQLWASPGYASSAPVACMQPCASILWRSAGV